MDERELILIKFKSHHQIITILLLFQNFLNTSNSLHARLRTGQGDTQSSTYCFVRDSRRITVWCKFRNK